MLRAWVLDKFAIVFCGVCALPFCVRVRDARARMAASLCVSTVCLTLWGSRGIERTVESSLTIHS